MGEEMIVVIGGTEWSGWKDISVRASMEGLAHGFQVGLSDVGDADISDITPGRELKLVVSKDGRRHPIFSGFIDDRKRTRDGSISGINISGRSKTADLVDCAAVYTTSTFTNIDFTEMAKKLVKPFGIKVISYLDPGEKIQKYTIKSGATVFAVLEENARKVGALLLTDWEGNLILSYADVSLRSDIDLVDGGNVKKLSENWNEKEKFSEYIFKGQGISAGGKPWDKKSTVTLKATATDPTATRYRPTIKTGAGKSTQSRLQKTAKWEAQVRSGRAKSYVAEVRGWLQGDDGQPWQINSVANLSSEAFGVNELLLITEVEMSKSSDGTLSSITLKDRRTYQANPTGGF